MDNELITIELSDFPEMIEEYLFDLEIRNYSKRTISTYNSILRNFYKYIQDQKEPIFEKDILIRFKEFIRYLKNDKNVSQNYIYLVTVVIKKFFIFSGIDALVDIQAPKRTRNLPKSLNEDEIKLLLKTPDKFDNSKNRNNSETVRIRNKLIMTLLYSSGLRVSELVNFKVKDLDLDERTIHVRGKGEKDRIVLFDYLTKDLIIHYQEKCRICSDYLFVNRHGNRLTPRYIQKMVKNYANFAGIKKKVTPHILRHSFATHLLKKGMDIRAIQKLMGHTNLTTTQIYTSVDMETLRTVYDRARLL